MTIQLTANSFLQMLAQSGLLSAKQMRRVRQRFSASSREVSTKQICDWLQNRSLVTDWQAEKLRQAKFRGFFLGPYKLLSRVARGGMSTIYAAQHKDSGQIHALKVLPPARTNKASYLPRFQREAAMTQRLQHPNIVRVYGVFSGSDGQDAVHFMAMELLSGRDLFEIVNADGPLPWRSAAEFIRQAALGLECAHQAGMVHRDVKPGNLFLTDDEQVRILDLGLAQDDDSAENLTRDFNERVLGTADYLAPEQAADSHTVDARADLYSLGCSLYFLLTGQPPFTEGTLVQRLIAHQTKTPPAISDFRNDVPEELAAIVSAMMEKDRSQRTNSAAIVANQLARFLADTIDQIHPTERPPALPGSAPASEPAPEQTANAALLSAAAAVSCVLPEFNLLLQRIEENCQPFGVLSADPRSGRLLALARDLTNLSATDCFLGDMNSGRSSEHKNESRSARLRKHRRALSSRSFLLVVTVTSVMLIAAVAATVAYRSRLPVAIRDLWQMFVR